MLASCLAVLSTPNCHPVTLNFARKGEDGRPTVYVTEGRQPQVPSPWILQPSVPAPNAQPTQPSWLATSAGPATYKEESPQVSSSCCCAPTYNNGASAGPAASEAVQAVDIVVTPAHPPTSGRAMKGSARGQEPQPPPDSCILGSCFKGCMPDSRNAQPAANQVRNIRLLGNVAATSLLDIFLFTSYPDMLQSVNLRYPKAVSNKGLLHLRSTTGHVSMSVRLQRTWEGTHTVPRIRAYTNRPSCWN